MNIEAMRDVGKLTNDLLNYITPFVVEGITTNELNDLCHNYTINVLGGESAPLNYKGFPKAICVSVNNVVCHGIPSDYQLRDGDIVNVDVTVKKKYNGVYHFGDSSRMFQIGNVKPRHRELCLVTEECLTQAIKIVKNNTPLSLIGETIQSIADAHGFSVVREFCGHGIGTEFHTRPNILHHRNNFYESMKTGMTFTVEPILNEFGPECVTLDDKWTTVTFDGGYSAQCEHTILVTDQGCEVLT